MVYLKKIVIFYYYRWFTYKKTVIFYYRWFTYKKNGDFL